MLMNLKVTLESDHQKQFKQVVDDDKWLMLDLIILNSNKLDKSS